MGNITDARASVEHGVSSSENADTFAKLDQAREAGTLANSREQAPPDDKTPELKLSFAEKTADELEKLTKKELITYMQEWHEHKDVIAAEMAKHAAAMAQRAAIHGIPMRPRGEEIPMLLEANPDHPGRQIPYPLLDEDGEPRMSKGNKRRKPSIITRTDN
jgi:hypothetical protein